MSEGQNTSEQSATTETESEAETRAIATATDETGSSTASDDAPTTAADEGQDAETVTDDAPTTAVDEDAEIPGDDDPETTAERESQADPSLSDVHGVDEETVERLREADVDAADVTDGAVSYQDLVAAGVDEDRATRIRRAYGLPWSVRTGEGDLEERSAALRGLGDEERTWIAESAGDWEERLAAAEQRIRDGDGSDGASGEREVPERPVLTPVTTIPGIDDEYADLLAEAGIVSVRTLAVADPMKVASALDIEPNRVTSWHWRAREQTDASDLLFE